MRPARDVTVESLHDAYETLRAFYAASGSRAEQLRSIGFGSGWISVNGTETQGGLAFSFNGEHAVHGQVDPSPLTSLEPFVGRDLFDLVEHLLPMSTILFRSVCVAALNALSHPFTARSALRERGINLAQDEEFDFVRETDTVTVVGYGRVIAGLKARRSHIHVCDLRPVEALRTLKVSDQTARGPAGVTFHGGAEANTELLGRSDVVFLTGSALVNDSLSAVIDACSSARVIGLFGPSAGLLPEYFLSLGVNYILYDRYRRPSTLTDDLVGSWDRSRWGSRFETIIVRTF